ncbi:hypothetical protein [Nioella nitratireducens]|uniref:hypothetical protein n=1 Tax=Nioella nitratireducens TaxID=1287720 RepID=UPI0008FD6AA6|nr:hypothetical protein [Nioella nitratireducens]
MTVFQQLGRGVGLCLWAVIAQAAHASEPILLTVSVDGEDTGFTRSALEALGTAEIETTTIWTDGVQHFSGVPLRALAEMFDVGDSGFRAYAINDYVIDIPLEDARDGGALLALDRDGEPMSLRDMGPIWLIYPYDSDRDFQTEVIYARSVWQLIRLEVMD